ncbi:SIS domain-containing protein [Olegusella massiliensis]|uniref:SIS domain-containing protein n=1 Tax=Olegusella massiliensis TaxID=1776381 RepID=UPI00083802A9|nr:SIS domain-containing protein [Olegusella massiliensis]
MAKPTMFDYVKETPEILRSLINGKPDMPLAQQFAEKKYSHIRIVACGSSRNAAEIARPFLRHVLRVEVSVTEPYSFCAYEHELPENEFCFVVSQSGYSTNALAALDLIRSSNKKAIGVTGDIHSDFSAASDVLIDYGVGEEQVGYVTKGVTSLAVFLMLFALDAAVLKNGISQKEVSEYEQLIEQTIHSFEQVIDSTANVISKRYKELSSMDRVFLIGAGANYGIAREGALKFGECLQFPAIAYELDEYLHGPNLQLDPNYTIFVNVVGEIDHKRAEQIIQATRLVTDKVFVLSDKDLDGMTDILIDSKLDSLCGPVALLPFYQISAWKLTEDKHLWHKHPLVAQFDHALSGKSENYVDKEVL